MPTVINKIFTEETESELINMTRDEVTLELPEKQIRFCEYYVKNFNIKLAAIKAGYSSKSAHIVGWRLRQKPEVQRYIAWLKLRVSKDCHVDAMDIIDLYARIAFQDINDFVTIKNGRIKLIDGEQIDGQLVKSIKQGRDGVYIDLNDRLAAAEKLERYFDVMPKDWKQKIEEKKLDLMKERLELERLKIGAIDDEQEDDGFFEALKGSATEIWGEEETPPLDETTTEGDNQ